MAEENGNGNGKFRITWEKVLTLVISVLLAYAAVNARVSVLESQQNANDWRLQRIETKVDELLRRP